ncbi:MAG TPA: permease-like cell division protein FtsX [Candidatus Paceibacterota bacterium]|nr:permease-like cell division protein FtsX [Candidatus Paceibacterota bacterium]
MITSIKRIVRSGFIGFWRNAFVSLSAIFVITVTLLVVGAMMLSSVLLSTTLTQIQEKVDINVYMVTTADENRILTLKSSLETLPEVAEVTYTSREDSLAQFTERHKNDELTMQALDELGENPLGASLSIRAKETSQYEGIATFLDEQKSAESLDAPLIDRINYNQNKIAIEKLTSITNTVERIGFLTMTVLIVSSILIAFNTIRLAIYTSREEIGIMRLVGASNMFIRGPFVLQGIMYGLISGIVTLLVLYPVVYWLGPRTEAFFLFNIYVYFVSNFGYLFSVIVGSGIVLGVVSSTLAIARHLRV